MTYDLAYRRGRIIEELSGQIDALKAERTDLRARLDVLDEALNERDNTIMDLRDVIADCERRIDLYGDRGDRDRWHPSTRRDRDV